MTRESYSDALFGACRMSDSRSQPRDGDRWFVNARRVLFVSPPSTTGDRYVWHTQSARTILQPTDRVDCIQASPVAPRQPQFTSDGTPAHSLKPPHRDGLGFKGGSATRHTPALEDIPEELQTPILQQNRARAFAQEHTRMFTSTHKTLFQTPYTHDRTCCFAMYIVQNNVIDSKWHAWCRYHGIHSNSR